MSLLSVAIFSLYICTVLYINHVTEFCIFFQFSTQKSKSEKILEINQLVLKLQKMQHVKKNCFPIDLPINLK